MGGLYKKFIKINIMTNIPIGVCLIKLRHPNKYCDCGKYSDCGRDVITWRIVSLQIFVMQKDAIIKEQMHNIFSLYHKIEIHSEKIKIV